VWLEKSPPVESQPAPKKTAKLIKRSETCLRETPDISGRASQIRKPKPNGGELHVIFHFMQPE